MSKLTLDEFMQPYEIQKEIGKGGFSTVYLGVEKATNKQVAIKCFQSQKSNNETIKKEFDIQKKFDCPYIVDTYGLFSDGDQYVLIMEYVNGGELFDAIVERGSYSEKDAADITQQVLLALKVLHENHIIHRDLKPENLLIQNTDDGKTLCKIADFGLSDIFTNEQMQTYCGTVGYACPEIMKNVPYDKSADIWSLGVIVYILLCGCQPFDGDDQVELTQNILTANFEFFSPEWDDISGAAKNFISRMLQVDQAKRISVDEALKHPWISGNAPSANLDVSKTHLRKFVVDQKAKRVISLLRSKNRFDLLKHIGRHHHQK